MISDNFTTGIISGIILSLLFTGLIILRGLFIEKVSMYIDLSWGKDSSYSLIITNISKFTIRTKKLSIMAHCPVSTHILSDSPIFINKKLSPGQMIKYNFQTGELDKDEIDFCLYYETVVHRIGDKIRMGDEILKLTGQQVEFYCFEQKTEFKFCRKEYGRKGSTGPNWTNIG